MSQAEPELLSFLQKVTNPLQQLNLTLELKGVFSPPEQWKTTDEANPNIFTYSVEMFQNTFAHGKIEPRKLTAKELKELEEAKNKKGGKKDTKEEEKPVQVDPEEERKKIEWEALSEEERFYRTAEDPYQMFSLAFPEKQMISKIEPATIKTFEECLEKGSIEILLTRKPEISEQEIAKLKKSKPKTLNLGELYAAQYRGSFDITCLSTPGCCEASMRVPLEFVGQVPPDCAKIEIAKCYINMELILDPAITPKVESIKPQVKELLPEFSNTLQHRHMNLISKLKVEIIRGVKAISQQYSSLFAKQKQYQQDRRHSNINNSISALKLSEINKKKQIFLTEFFNSDKFTILKDRIGSTIKAICVDKFRKEKQAGPVDKNSIHRTLDELNVYFAEFIQKTVDSFMFTENHMLHEDIIIGHENARSIRKQTLAPVLDEQEQERELRLAEEYETANQVKEAEEKYLNLILTNEESLPVLETYAKFCLKNKKFDESYALYRKISDKSEQLKYKNIISMFLIQRGRVQEALELLSGMLNDEKSTLEDKIMYNLLLSLMYEGIGDIKFSEKYLEKAERYHQVFKNPHLKLVPIKNPYNDPTPQMPKPARYTSQLSSTDTQKLRMSLISSFAENHFFDLVQKFLFKLDDSYTKKILEIKVKVFKEEYDSALEILDQLIKQERSNIDLLLMRADICFKSDRIFESEEVFLQILKLKPNQSQTFSTYLRLGLTYLNRKSWEDANNVFSKACQLRVNSALTWLGLGISNLNLKNMRQAEQALNLSNIYNPLGKEAEAHLNAIKQQIQREHKDMYPYLDKSQ